MSNPTYKRVTCLRIECAAMTYRRANRLDDYFRMPCECKAGVLVKAVTGVETIGDNDINPRLYLKKPKIVEEDLV